MMIDDTNMETYLVEAIRRKAAYERMESLDREADARQRKTVRLRRIVYTVAASVVLVACGGSIRYYRSAQSGYACAQEALASVTVKRAPELSEAVDLLKEGQTGQSLICLQALKESTSIRLEELSDSDSDFMERMQLMAFQQELDWYTVLALLQDKKVFKAKRQLKQIARSGGAYASSAENILKKL